MYAKRFLVPMIVCGCSQGGDPLAVSPDAGGGGGGCGDITLSLPLPASQLIAGSYAGRSFLSPVKHIGIDFAALEGTPIKAVLPGRIVYYGPARGYGDLVVVIEHDLGEELPFVNGRGETIWTRYILTISGHLRNSEIRGGERLGWSLGDFVEAGDVIGYVNDDAHNGDGAEHLHFGVRLSSASEAQAVDPRAWFRGYDTTTQEFRGDFADGVEVITVLDEYLGCASDEPSEIIVPELELHWQTPSNIRADRITLSGRIKQGETELVAWREWAETNGHGLGATLTLEKGQSFEFSIEYEYTDVMRWSCEGDRLIRGALNVLWNGTVLQAVPHSNGVGGCNLVVSTNGPYGETESIAIEEEHRGDGSHYIYCGQLDGDLIITTSGPISTGVMDGTLSGISFISLGSNVNGWQTQTTLPTYYAIYNGDNFMHTIRVPGEVNRFNLWAASTTEVRWLDLRLWEARDAGCQVIQEGDGYIVIR